MPNRSMQAKELRSRKQSMEACLQESLKICYLEQGKVRAASMELAKSAEASLAAWQIAQVEKRAQRIRLRSHF